MSSSNVTDTLTDKGENELEPIMKTKLDASSLQSFSTDQHGNSSSELRYPSGLYRPCIRVEHRSILNVPNVLCNEEKDSSQTTATSGFDSTSVQSLSIVKPGCRPSLLGNLCGPFSQLTIAGHRSSVIQPHAMINQKKNPPPNTAKRGFDSTSMQSFSISKPRCCRSIPQISCTPPSPCESIESTHNSTTTSRSSTQTTECKDIMSISARSQLHKMFHSASKQSAASENVIDTFNMRSIHETSTTQGLNPTRSVVETSLHPLNSSINCVEREKAKSNSLVESFIPHHSFSPMKNSVTVGLCQHIQTHKFEPHSFKCKSKTSSLRTIAAADVLVNGIALESRSRAAWKHYKRRRNKKTKKLSEITNTKQRSESIFLPSSTLLYTPHFFVSNSIRSSLILPIENIKPARNVVRYSNDDFTIYDNILGACHRLPNSDILFILIPRTQSTRALGNLAQNDIELMNSVMQSSVSTKRGTGKLMISTADVGYRPMRGEHGIKMSRVLRSDQVVLKGIKNLCSRTEHAARSFIPSDHLHRLSLVRDAVAPYNTITSAMNKANIGISAAVSISKDYISAAHIDKDFFHSITTVRSELYSDGIGGRIDWNSYTNPPVAQHFLFPEYGVGVGLRPGDILVFNPCYYHCCGHKLDAYSDIPFYLATFYVKTANVGANDNRIPLTKLQLEILQKHD